MRSKDIAYEMINHIAIIHGRMHWLLTWKSACCRAAAKQALLAYNGYMQIGGGINPDNAAEWLDSGASHVIVTSYIFQDGELSEDRLKQLVTFSLALLCCLYSACPHHHPGQ